MNSKLPFKCNKQKLVVVYSLNCVRLFVTPWTVARQASLSFTITWSLLRLNVHWVVMPSNHLFLFHPLLLLSSIFPSVGVFSNKSSLHIRLPKYWKVSFSISPSNEYSGLISFRIDWFDLPAIQGLNPLQFCFKTLPLSKYQSVPRKRDQWTSRNLAYEFHLPCFRDMYTLLIIWCHISYTR